MSSLVKVYGERNTGTKYLRRLIRSNFDIEILPGITPNVLNNYIQDLNNPDFYKDIYFKLSLSYNLGWKHREFKNSLCFRWSVNRLKPNLTIIAIIKNPYSWLLSLFKKPYHFSGTKDLSFEEFLVTPWKTVKRENATSLYENPIVMWNKKNHSYLRLKKSYELAHIVRYEDLVMDPPKVVEKLNLKQKGNSIDNLHNSTVNSNKNYNYYKDYYGNEKWKAELNEKNIQLINKYLDKDLMKHFKYEIL